MKKRIVKRIITIGTLGLLSGLLFCFLRTMLIDGSMWRDLWTIGEKVLYIVFAILVGTIYKYLYDILKGVSSKVFVSLGLAIAFTICVFFANNYFHYLEWNSEVFNLNYHIPYNQFVKHDIIYTYGYGEFRYIFAFLAMCSVNLLIIVWFKRTSPMLKKWIQDIGLWYFGPNEKTIENKIQRLLTGADYSDFISEINCMPQNKETKDLFKKLINKYDEECKMIEFYQALFIRFWEYLSREEYLEYRQRYLDNFDEPLPEKCNMLDEMFGYKTCNDNTESTTD